MSMREFPHFDRGISSFYIRDFPKFGQKNQTRGLLDALSSHTLGLQMARRPLLNGGCRASFFFAEKKPLADIKGFYEVAKMSVQVRQAIQKPASERQLAYIKRLSLEVGQSVPELGDDISSFEASTLIGELIGKGTGNGTSRGSAWR